MNSARSKVLPSVLLRETPLDTAIFDRRDPLEKFLDKNLKKSQVNLMNKAYDDQLTDVDN